MYSLQETTAGAPRIFEHTQPNRNCGAPVDLFGCLPSSRRSNTLLHRALSKSSTFVAIFNVIKKLCIFWSFSLTLVENIFWHSKFGMSDVDQLN